MVGLNLSPRVSARGARFLSICALSLAISMPAAAQPASGATYKLASTRGTEVTNRTYLGKVQAVLFGFASCPDICPTALSSLSQGLSILGPKRRDVRILFISVDRARDTMPMLKTYVSAFAPETIGLTGGKAQIDAAVKAFRAHYAIDGKGDSYRVSHTGLIYLLDRKGRVAKLLPPATSGKRLAAELQRLVDAP